MVTVEKKPANNANVIVFLILTIIGIIGIVVSIIQTPEVSKLFTAFRYDPLWSAESNKRLLLERESESDPEPFLSLREECET